MEENRHVPSIGRPFVATSQVWIDTKHGEMTLLVGDEKVKFDLHQNLPLTGGEMRMCMSIESLLLPIEKHAPMFLQDKSLGKRRCLLWRK